jgi:two-component system, chemotaxis family, protein-glutamate methylesterase/glutaminase
MTPHAQRPAWLTVIAASAGGVHALQQIVRGFPPGFPGAVVIIQHRKPHDESLLEQILQRGCDLPVRRAEEAAAIEPGTVYVARPDRHLIVQGNGTFGYQNGHRRRFVLPSANPVFESAAKVFGAHVIAVVLTGCGINGTDGVQTVKANDGTVIVQDPASALFGHMPRAAIATGVVDRVLPLEQIAPAVVSIVQSHAAASGA